MAEMLSPGVFVTEIDASTIVPTVSNSIATFGGKFAKGQVDKYTLITSVDDLISYYGKPTNTNYNDFYQAYNFLQYGNKLLVSRAANVGGTATDSGEVLGGEVSLNDTTVAVADTSGFSVGGFITLGTDDNVYRITAIVGNTSLALDRGAEAGVASGDAINHWTQDTNGVAEVLDATSVATIDVNDYVANMMVIQNADDFDLKESSIAMSNSDAKLKIISRNPGAWASDIEIAIANPAAFGAATPSEAFDGISLDDLYEYAPTGTEIALIVRYKDEIVETWTVDFDQDAKDYNNKSTYIENVINNGSNYIFVKDNTANTDSIADACASVNGTTGSTVTLSLAMDSDIQNDDITNAYDVFSNKEELDIDIVIGNERDGGAAAKELVDTRKDCIAFIGAEYGDTVGKKSATAVANLVDWRKTGNVNYNNMFVVAVGNYKYQYDRYNDKYRWINIAGDIAGLRAQTSMNRASWWASAGLERGQIKNVTKLAFNPTQGQRDLLYKNGINPVVAFPGQGTVMWGQKTLLDKPSSFDRVNVRGLFNTMERALSKMAKYQVMEFNDNFTRNRIVSMIKPYLSSVQAGRGIQDFLVICDESNNTADVISRNQLIVDIYIKPTYVAEFIQLRFTNAGTNSFAEVIGG